MGTGLISGDRCCRLSIYWTHCKQDGKTHRNQEITGIFTIIDRLVDKGNTVIVIEHNINVIRNADWIIDVGVEGGNRGGQILFEGTPVNLRNCKESITVKYL